MRPRRLEIEGFTVFRGRTIVDFEDADLFAFTGPTGAGKSSLIDAIVFALYGSVPRYGDRRSVAPLITLGKLEARVRFDFTVEGEDWVATRVVRRTQTGGASTGEARLERGSDVVAGTADEVTGAVERLLGLRFEHFTKTVVLPQGEFARFLHDKPAQRQALLRSLLDLEAYSAVRELANERASVLQGQLHALDGRLGELGFADTAAREEAAARLDALRAVHARIEAMEPKLDSETKQATLALEEAATARQAGDLVSRLRQPEAVEAVSSAWHDAVHSVRSSESEADRAAERVAGLESRPRLDRVELTGILRAWGDLAKAREARDRMDALLAAALRDQEGAAAAADLAAKEAETARRDAEKARGDHAAHLLAETLVPGAPCPVCGHVVEARVVPESQPDVLSAEHTLQQVDAAAAEAIDQVAVARERVAGLGAQRETTAAEISELEAELAERPPRDQVEGDLTTLDRQEAELDQARASDREARRALAHARETHAKVESDLDGLKRDFDQARDAIAALGPPVPEREELASDWSELLRWAAARAAALEQEGEQAKQRSASHQHRAETIRHDLDELLEDHGIAPPEAGSREKASFEALTTARHELDRITEAISDRAALEGEIRQAGEAKAVAATLALHLRADRFEAWLLDEAFSRLVAGANELLLELSENSYSLELSDRKFQIVDHRNADETRSVRTLSGGETFLVSLALALSLAEQLATVSSRGLARIETIILDEGFGTLDRETLETVGTVIHTLGAGGRTVGIVTHVAELADQVPVRYEVSRDPDGATVHRVGA